MIRINCVLICIVGLIASCRSVRSVSCVSQDPPASQRRMLAIFMDGTRDMGFDEKSYWKNTSVKKLHNETLDGIKTFYVEGVGARMRLFDAIKAFTTSKRTMKAYRFIAENYTPGDSICMFGFSRGANQCRILSSIIHTVGILNINKIADTTQREKLLKKMYKRYIKIPNTEKKERLIDWLKGKGFDMPGDFVATDTTRVELMGLWDTVEGFDLGGGQQITPKSWHLNQLYNVKKLFHAVSLDDNRSRIYTPILATHKDVELAPGQDINKIVDEVWFNGSHKNLGGGVSIREKDSLTGLSLGWMYEKMKAYKIFNKPASIADTFATVDNPRSKGGWITSFRSTLRSIDQYRAAMNPQWNDQKIKVHRSVIARLEKGITQSFKTRGNRMDWYQLSPFRNCFDEKEVDGKKVWKYKPEKCDCIEVVN